MADRTPLDPDAIHDALEDLPGWSFDDDTLTASFELADFQEAVAFIVRIGFHAEDLNHHPELFNVYNTVDITLTTHDAGNTVTALDVEMARRINDCMHATA